MSGAAGALALLVRDLPNARIDHGSLWRSVALDRGGVLIVADTRIDRDHAMGEAVARSHSPPAVSRSGAADRYALLTAPGGRVGLDMETIERVALNATARDDWLALSERHLVEQSAAPVLELACHWVLKEAYGKALGVGLDLPLSGLAFAQRGGSIALDGHAAPSDHEGWRFALYRDGDLLFGTAPQVVTPLAPAGRKPPTPLPDR